MKFYTSWVDTANKHMTFCHRDVHFWYSYTVSDDLGLCYFVIIYLSGLFFMKFYFPVFNGCIFYAIVLIDLGKYTRK